MVDKAQSGAGMFEEYVNSLLPSPAPLGRQRVFRQEGLIPRQANEGRLGQTGRVGAGQVLLLVAGHHVLVCHHGPAPFPPVLPLHRRRHTLVVRLAEARRTETPQEGESVRGRQGLVRVRTVLLGVLGLAAGCL